MCGSDNSGINFADKQDIFTLECFNKGAVDSVTKATTRALGTRSGRKDIVNIRQTAQLTFPGFESFIFSFQHKAHTLHDNRGAII